MYNVNIVMESIKKLKYVSGKSTVASLLERFYDPTSGVVKLDGLDIRTLDLSWLRGQVIGFINQVLIIFHKSLYSRYSYMSSHSVFLSLQEPVLFGSSIMENIRFGKPEATDAEVINAAEQANAHRFITSFPDGYNTVVGTCSYLASSTKFVHLYPDTNV